MAAQHMEALKKANYTREEGRRQREELAGAPVSVVVQTVLHPSPELASMRLGYLFGSRNSKIIPHFGPYKLEKALRGLREQYPFGRVWSDSLKLKELSVEERRRLARAIVARSPKNWRATV